MIICHSCFSQIRNKKHSSGHPDKTVYATQVSPTSERIDLEKLKAREQIMFFEDVLLFEDELHDHGVSMISVKIVSDVHFFLCFLRMCWYLLIYNINIIILIN